MKYRNSNIEALRVIAMLGVIALHYVNGSMGGINCKTEFPDFVWIFVTLVRGFAIPLVNVFVIITGYFLIQSRKFSMRKPIELLVIVAWYGMLFYIGGCVFGLHSFSVKELIKNIAPYFFGQKWFIKTYIILYLLFPFLNVLLNNLKLKDYQALLVIQVSIFSLWYSLGYSSPINDDGYGIINFITLYFIGGYIRRFSSQCRVLTRINFGKGFVGYVFASFCTAALSIAIWPFGYAYITNVLAATLLFVAFVKLPVRENKIVNRLAVHCFDVFFVHIQIIPYLGIMAAVESNWLVIHFITSLVVCYLLGSISGFFRALIFKHTVNKILGSIQWINQTHNIILDCSNN